MIDHHSDRAHARLAPSSAHRWLKCPGSVRLSEGLPETPSIFAEEGTAAHELAHRCMETGKDAVEYKGQMFGQFKVDADMIDGVQTYLDVVREIAEQSEEFEVEQRMDITALVEGVFGTGDAIAYRSTPTRRVTIVDLKYGRGVPVDVVENEQELTYALGVAQRYHNRGVDEVELVIVQPRAPHRDGPVRRWLTDVDTLYAHAMALQDAAVAANAPDAALVPGAWCKFCKAIPVCPALQDRAMSIIGGGDRDVLGNLIMADPTSYNADDLAEKLRDLPLVATWLKGVEQFAHAEALRGHMPSGFKLVGKRATRKWKDADTAVSTLQIAGVSDDDIFETTVRSPAQVEKAIPKADRESLLTELAIKQSSGTALAPVDDPRPAVDPNDARGFEPTTIAERE